LGGTIFEEKMYKPLCRLLLRWALRILAIGFFFIGIKLSLSAYIAQSEREHQRESFCQREGREMGCINSWPITPPSNRGVYCICNLQGETNKVFFLRWEGLTPW